MRYETPQNKSKLVQNKPELDPYIIVATNEPGVVNFRVTSSFHNKTYHVKFNQTTRVSFPAQEAYVTNITQKDKGILVKADAG